jgi:glycerophosphoryl diester phosphodiesterase
MRSSPSVPDPLEPGPAGFAHRGLHHGSGFPENSLSAFAAALELGAGIETDLRLTADDEIVLFHDADAWRMCASPLRIAETTSRELARLRVGEHPVPTLTSLLKLVEGRVPLLLEVKVNDDIWRWVPALRRALDGYRERFAIMAFDPRISRLLKTNMPSVRRGLLVQASLGKLKRRLYLGLADPEFIAVEREALAGRWVQRIRRRVPVYGWTIQTEAQRAQAEVHADTLIWEGDGRPRI